MYLTVMGLVGTALLYADGTITPAISVLSAVEGLAVDTPEFGSYVVPITVVILAVLFSVQRLGSGWIGGVFGPLMPGRFALLRPLGILCNLAAPRGVAGVSST